MCLTSSEFVANALAQRSHANLRFSTNKTNITLVLLFLVNKNPPSGVFLGRLRLRFHMKKLENSTSAKLPAFSIPAPNSWTHVLMTKDAIFIDLSASECLRKNHDFSLFTEAPGAERLS